MVASRGAENYTREVPIYLAGECCGYLADGTVCRRPAVHVDEESGGMLCDRCWQAKQERKAREAGAERA